MIRPKHIAIRAMLWDGGYGKHYLLAVEQRERLASKWQSPRRLGEERGAVLLVDSLFGTGLP